MSLYKFNSNDVYVNTVKTFPSVKFVIYSGSAYYNNNPNISGAFANPVRLTNAGNISLYELNVDRANASTGRSIGGVTDNGLIYPWVVKNGSRIAFRTTTSASYNSANYGAILTSSYPMTATISKNFYSTSAPRFDAAPALGSGSVSYIYALKNTINEYRHINPEFQYSSSARSFDDIDLGLISIPTIFYG